MTAVSRTRLDQCATKDCPWRDDWDFHQIPWCQGIRVVGVGGVALGHPLPVTHQHWPKRSQGGKEIVALLCFMCHDRIDNRDWGNAVYEHKGQRIYRIWDLHGEILYERVLGVAATGEGEAVSAAGSPPGFSGLPSPAAPAPSATDEEGSNPGVGVSPARAAVNAAAVTSSVAPGARAPEQAGRDSRESFDSRSSPAAVTPPSFSTQEDKDGIREGLGAGNERRRDSATHDSDEGRGTNVARQTIASLDSTVRTGDGHTLRSSGEPPTALQEVRGENTVDPYTFGDNGIEWEPEFTFDDWARAAERVKTESVGRQWRVGDLVNAERWAECSQFYDDLGYPPETQANYGRISAAYKLAERRPLSFGHHQAVYKHELRLALLDAAVENHWTVKELRADAYPAPRIRIRRFTIEYLREDLAGYENRALRNNGRRFAEAWLESLEQA